MRKGVIVAMTAGVALFAVVGAGTWLIFASLQHTRLSSSAPMADVTVGTIRIDDAAERVTITSADLGSTLYRLVVDYVYSAPDFSDGGGHLYVGRASNVVNFWGRPRDVIDLTVNRSVLWSTVIDGAGSVINLDFSSGRLQSFTVNGAGNDLAVKAGPPHGVVTVMLSGVGSRLRMQLPPATEFRATADGIGASVGGNAETDGWSSAQDRYDVSINGVGVQATITNQAGL